jgi:hypothetical protein
VSRFREPEHPGRRSTRYHWAAGRNPWHWVVALGGWISAAMFAATAAGTPPEFKPLFMSISGMAVMGALAWSGVWMLVVPNLPRFKRAVDAKLAADFGSDYSYQLESLLPQIDSSLQPQAQDIGRLRDKAREMLARKFGEYDVFAKENLGKLDELAVQYLKMLAALTEYDQYLSLVDPAGIQQQLEEAEAHQDSASSEAVSQARSKQVLLLQTRLERYQRAEQQMQLIQAQCKNVEATMKLLVDQAMTAQDAQRVGKDIDEVLANIESSEVLSAELSSLNDLDGELGSRGKARS